MDPQPHPLLHFLVRMKPTYTNVFLLVAKNVEVTRGKIWAVRTMLKCLPAKSLKRIPHKIGTMEAALLCKKMIPSDSIPGRFDFMARRSTLSHQERNHTCLFFACLHFQCWTNTLYTTLTSRAIKKQLCGPVRFHYADNKCFQLLRGMYFMTDVRFSLDFPLILSHHHQCSVQ